METEVLLDIVDKYGALAPQEIWEEAKERWLEIRDEVVSRLVRRLEGEDPVEVYGVLPELALYLAADRRDAGFLPITVRMFRASVKERHDLLGDIVTEEGPNLLTNLCPPGTDLSLLWQWFDETPKDWNEALMFSVLAESLLLLAEEGHFTRKFLLDKICEKLADPAFVQNKEACAWAVSALANFHEEDRSELVKPFFENQKVDERIIDWDTYHGKWLKQEGWNSGLVYKPIHALEEFQRWKEHWNEDLNRPTLRLERKEPKIGRNDPCPCGSGKKHKKCCGKV